MSTRSKKKLEEIKTGLFSNDTNTVLQALHQLDEYPYAELVEPLLVLYAQKPAPAVAVRLQEILTTLKVSGVEEIFMKALRAPELKHCRKDFFHFMWSSNIQPEEGWVLIAELAASGTYEECLEILSLLDNTEHELLEEELLEAVSILKMSLNEHPDEEAAPMRKLLLEGFSDRLNQ
jgi:hypothetical protein